MGGKALSCGSVRVDTPTYLKAGKNVLDSLKTSFPTAQFCIPRHLPSKDNFGDVDILYAADSKIKPDELVIIVDGIEYKPKYPFVNSDVLSFEYPISNEYLQIDLIKVPKESFLFSYNYFSNGDLGNIIGRLYHKSGFKFSSEGLKYHYISKYKSIDITLTTDWENALDFMKYPNYYSVDFFDVVDCLQYAFSSPYTNKEMYNIEDGNHANRIRNIKRPMFMYMQQYIKEHDNITANFDWSNLELLRWKFFVEAQNKFPELKKQYNELKQDDKLEEQYRNKFNGNVIIEITGHTKKALNDFMIDFAKKYITDKIKWRNDVLDMSEKDLHILIKKFNEQRIN